MRGNHLGSMYASFRRLASHNSTAPCCTTVWLMERTLQPDPASWVLLFGPVVLGAGSWEGRTVSAELAPVYV